MSEEVDAAPKSSNTKPPLPGVDSDDSESQAGEPFPAYNLLRAAVLSDVMKWLEEDRARRRTASLTVASITTVALVAIAGVIVNELLVFNVERTVNQVISENLSSVTFQSRVAALNFRAVALDQADGFSVAEANVIVQSIESLYETGIGDIEDDNNRIPSDVRSQNIADLMFAVETAVESFAAADRNDLVAQIRNVAPAVSERSSVMTQIMVHMTGRNLIGLAGGADSWRDRAGIEQGIYQEYEQYAARARETGFPELFLVFELIIRHMEGRPDEEIRQLAAEVVDLNEVDRDAFITVMTSLVQGAFIDAPTAASERVMARTREFLETYRDSSSILESILLSVDVGSADLGSSVPTSQGFDSAEPITIGQVERHSFRPDGQVGWYRVSIDDALPYRIDVTSVDGDPIITLGSFDDQFEELASDDDGGSRTDARIDIDLEPGVYYLSVRNFTGGEGNFSLVVRSRQAP